MQDYQREFIELAIECQALRFGEFTLKSGRKSPYFFNIGLFNHGKALAKLGEFYAAAFVKAGVKVDTLFGPAYKGIPLVTSMVIALAQQHQIDLPYSFNRKQAKDHGEGGVIVGAPLKGRVLVIDDVITAGTAIREAIDIIGKEGATFGGVLISLDRQERGTGEASAIQEVAQRYEVPVISIVSLKQVMEYVSEQDELRAHLPSIEAYRAEYGVG